MSPPALSDIEDHIELELDPHLGAIGRIIGLVDQITPDEPRYKIKLHWFEDPLGPVRDITKNPQALIDVIVTFLEPEQTSPLGDERRWHEIRKKSGNEAVDEGGDKSADGAGDKPADETRDKPADEGGAESVARGGDAAVAPSVGESSDKEKTETGEQGSGETTDKASEETAEPSSAKSGGIRLYLIFDPAEPVESADAAEPAGSTDSTEPTGGSTEPADPPASTDTGTTTTDPGGAGEAADAAATGGATAAASAVTQPAAASIATEPAAASTATDAAEGGAAADPAPTGEAEAAPAGTTTEPAAPDAADPTPASTPTEAEGGGTATEAEGGTTPQPAEPVPGSGEEKGNTESPEAGGTTDPPEDKPTTETSEAGTTPDAPDADETTKPEDNLCRVALGAAYKYESAGDHPITLEVVLQVPVLDLKSGEFLLKTGSKESIVLFVQLGSEGGFSAGGNTFDSLDLTVTFFLDRTPKVDLILKNLSLGHAEAKDVSVIELAKDPGALVGEGLKTLVTGALHLATTTAAKGKDDEDQAKLRAMEADVLWLLGLKKDAKTELDVPELNWGRLAGTSFGAEWSRWFESIVADPKTLKAWLQGVHCLTQGLDVTERKAERDKDVPGAGSVADPFAVTIAGGDAGEPEIQLTLGVAGKTITPGLRALSSAIHPSDEVELRIAAEGQLGAIPLRGAGFNVQPTFELAARAKNDTGALFTYAGSDGQTISPNAFAAGLRLTQTGGTKLTPFADFKDAAGKITSLVALWGEADPLGKLLDKLKDEASWESLLTQVIPAESGLAYRERGIEFAYSDSADGEPPLALNLRIAAAGEKGLTVAADVRAGVEWLTLSFQGGIGFADLTKLGAPKLTFDASLGGNENEARLVPTVRTGLDSQGAFTLAVELPIKDAPSPWRLSLVPFKGITGFSINDVWPLLEGAILDSRPVKAWLESPLVDTVKGCTWATILTKWPLLQKQDGGKYRFPRTADKAVDVVKLKALRPLELAETALSELLATMDELPLVAIGKEGGLHLTHNKVRSSYGLRLALPDVAISRAQRSKPNGKDKGKQKGLDVTLQVGNWMERDTERDNWLTRGGMQVAPAGGISLDLITIDNGKPRLSPGLKLTSVGVDVDGTEAKPLFDKSGYRLEGVQARLNLDIAPFKIGGGVRLDRAAIPLGPRVANTGSSNPVASGLLASGESGGTTQRSGAPANPVFGVEVGYADKLYGRVFSEDPDRKDPEADGKLWIPIKKSFGPLYCRKIGLAFDKDGPRLEVGYDGSVALGPLGIDLIDLSVGIPVRHPQQFKDYSLTLSGLNLSFSGGPVEISGGFLKSRYPDTPDGIVQYTGGAMIKAQAFSITGLGSYAVIDGAPSLFVFAVLNKDIGGPAFFFVTALAAGFGFKRKLILPSIEEVQDYPLVKVIQQPDYLGKNPNDKSALQKLSECIPPDPDAYWLAIGVKFLSFRQIETVALLSVSFGAEVSVSILGLSTLTMPSNLKKDQSPLSYAELALRAEFNPSVGVLSVEARLTSNSYIFDKSCKLTGGFAFYTWFRGPHEGDFVVTLGGYHPKFIRPSHYPVVPRLGIDWVKGSVRITGELYFALTPSCLMAGGKLCAVYDGGWVQAWFTAYADFLISWKPFHYDAAMGVSIGVTAHVHIDLGLLGSISFTLSFELGVDLHIWGPEFAGTARIKFYVVSFQVSFGAQSGQEVLPIAWTEFTQTFLPNKNSVCGVSFTGGLLQEVKSEDGQSFPILNGHELAFSVQSQAPCSALSWGTQDVNGGRSWAGRLGVSPMFAGDLNSSMTVELTGPDGKVDAALFDLSVVAKGFPAAMWGQGKPDLSNPSSKILENVPAGIAVKLSERGKQGQVRGSLPPMSIQLFAYEVIPKIIPWSGIRFPDTAVAPGQRTLSNTIWDNAAVSDKRAGILAALAGVTPYPLNEVSLPLTAAQAATIFQARPTYARLGQLLPEEK